MDILTQHEHLSLQSVGGVDSDTTCVDMCIKHEHDRGHGTPLSDLTSFDEFKDSKWFLRDLNLMRTWETKRMMSDFRDMIVSMVAQAPQPNTQSERTSTKERDRAGRSRSPNAD